MSIEKDLDFIVDIIGQFQDKEIPVYRAILIVSVYFGCKFEDSAKHLGFNSLAEAQDFDFPAAPPTRQYVY